MHTEDLHIDVYVANMLKMRFKIPLQMKALSSRASAAGPALMLNPPLLLLLVAAHHLLLLLLSWL
jgi:hypothetical protein